MRQLSKHVRLVYHVTFSRDSGKVNKVKYEHEGKEGLKDGFIENKFAGEPDKII